MKQMAGWKLVGMVGAILIVLVTPGSSSGSHKEHPYRYSDVDMPVSLAAGTARTPDFAVGGHWYWIMIQVEKPLPFQQMICMMGVTTSPLESKNCSSDDPLLRADWTVWDGGQI